jgi:hypothetical protein
MVEASTHPHRKHTVQFFSIERIKQAIDHLAPYRSDWVIIPLVLASNEVDEHAYTNLQGEDQVGTNGFLDRFFSGELMGLPPKASGNALRPYFREMKKRGSPNYVAHQSGTIWGNFYSSRGYRQMADRRILDKQGTSEIRLTQTFLDQFANELAGFQFEELLVWLFAFTGFPDEIHSWAELEDYFQDTHMGAGKRFPAAYRTRFRTSGAVPWPADILNERPSDVEYQRALLPSTYTNVGPPTQTYTAADFETRTHLGGDALPILESLIKDKGQIVLYGPPGTGKTHVARELALFLTRGDPENVAVVQFHPAYSYEDFIIGLKPELNPDSGQLSYEPAPGAFLTLAENAQKSREPFVIIIDEINRGNLPRIFGELMYLLEYRSSEPMDDVDIDSLSDALSRASIAHREMPFVVPPNVYVIGTMNTSDRSIGQIDLALRRRFHFYPVLPSRPVLSAYYQANEAPAGALAVQLFQRVNEVLRRKSDFPHDMIGHSFFMHPGLDEPLLRIRYQYSVVPLVEEMLYDQPELIDRDFDFDVLTTGARTGPDTTPPDAANTASAHPAPS